MFRMIMIHLIVLFLLLPVSAISADKEQQLQNFKKQIESMLKKGILPIIDTEFHLGPKIEAEEIVGKMDQHGVALTWAAPILKLGSEESLRFNEMYPGRFVPTTMSGESKKWHRGHDKFLEKLERHVRTGDYFVMGEFEARHYPSKTNSRDVHTPVDSHRMQLVFQLSEEMGMPFVLHHEAEDELLPELERMLVKYPKAKVVWAHVGRVRNPDTWIKFSKADGVREFLIKYPNLYFNFLQSRPGSRYKFGEGYSKDGHIEGVMYDYSSGKVKLHTQWKKLIEDFPDRFVIGSDTNTGRGIAKYRKYDRVTYIFRDIILSGLKPDVAEKVAYKNAWKLMSGKDWN